MENKKVTTVIQRKKRKHPWAFPLGLAIIALAVVGTITLISFGINEIKMLTDKSAQKAKYETFLTEVVRNDPDPFDDIGKANKADLLDSAIWYFLKNEGLSKKTYAYSELDPIGYIVPVADIDVAYKTLFGDEFQPVYDTINGPGYSFVYDTVKNSYIIPLTGADPIYSPKVYIIDTKGDSIILTVGYLLFGEWARDGQGKYMEPEPDKYMKITLRKTESTQGYYVSAIQASAPPETADPSKKKATTAAESKTAEPSTEGNTTALGDTTAQGETTVTGAPVVTTAAAAP